MSERVHLLVKYNHLDMHLQGWDMCLQGLDMHQQIKICVYKAQTGICQTKFVSGRQRLVSARLRHASAGTDLDLQMCIFPGSHTKRQKTGSTVCAYTARTLWEHQAWWSNLPYLWVAVLVKDQEVVGWVLLLFTIHSALWWTQNQL